MDSYIDTIKYAGSEIRIDVYLTNYYDEYSRSMVQKKIKLEEVKVNDKAIKANFVLTDGDNITVIMNPPVESKIEAENIPLNVVYEDKDIIVINKVSGMVVHPAVGNKSGTLVNALLYHCHDLSGINGETRPGIVHRLDKNTSGLIVCAKNDNAHKILSNQFAAHTVNKIYYALVYGDIDHTLGKIDAPIGRDIDYRQRMAINPHGKEAVTNFKVLEKFNGYTLLELKLETGRTHQIRVHLKYIKHPLVGDEIYGPAKVIGKDGQLLHAKKLGFKHPVTGEYMEFEIPLPLAFEEILDKLRKNKSID